MSTARSVALSRDVDAELRKYLLRADGQEDICLATYSTSTGHRRTSRLLTQVELPRDGERLVHGNATITGAYVLRAATLAAQRGEGVAILHSHPRGRGWQRLSQADHDTEASYADLARRLTGLPLVGLTLAGDGVWSAREWPSTRPDWAGSVRVSGDTLAVSWNPSTFPPPEPTPEQARTLSAWGPAVQADIARLNVLVVGLGSTGLDIAQRLAATGVTRLGLMDFDIIKAHNRDRMIGATRDDVADGRKKVAVGERLARSASTATEIHVQPHDESICTPAGLSIALDYDVIFCCVDRPWPRATLNGIAYSDLIPVIDGGLALDVFDDGTMRGGTWRVQTATPGRPCFACAGQIAVSDVTLDQQGLLDDLNYLAAAGRDPLASQNVAALAASVSAEQLAQFVSLVAAPAGRGVPPPVRYLVATHQLEHLPACSDAGCHFERRPGEGDRRIVFTRPSVSGRS